jgi:heme A synthase
MQENTKKRLTILAVLAGLNILLGNLVVGDGQQLSGEVVLAHSPEMRRATLTTFLFSLQLVALLLGALAAAVPYRKKSYDEKVLTFSLLIAIGLQGLFLLAGIYKLLF